MKLNTFISGAILFDETIKQSSFTGESFVNVMQRLGMIPGIKVDGGVKPFQGHPDELLTDGLDGLANRVSGYYNLGARFAKWRAVITISHSERYANGADIPSAACIEANATALARYAAIAFLSGGQTNEQASAHLNAMNVMFPQAPWAVTFSYARAIQQSALDKWCGDSANVAAAQKILAHRAACNSAASIGTYTVDSDRQLAVV